MGRLWYNLQLETQKENCKRSEKDRDYNFIAKNHQNKCVKAINKNTKEVLYCNCLYTVHIGINAGIIKTAREVVKKRSAMRTYVACETELLFSVWCLIEFLLEELITDCG